MGGVRIVTGYIPIIGHPRKASEYDELGNNMFGPMSKAGLDIMPFMETVQETWLWKLIGDRNVMQSIADNPEKNTLSYHCVQHQKFAWLLKAAIADPTPETFVWLDYGIGHVPGVTPDGVEEFVYSIRPGDFAIPGCWTREYARDNSNFLWPNWRFCGGVMVVPKDKVHRLYKLIKQEVANHIARTNNVTWEVNSLANIERCLPGPPRWYQADHNETMFTNYGVDLCKTSSLPVSAAPSAVTSSPT